MRKYLKILIERDFKMLSTTPMYSCALSWRSCWQPTYRPLIRGRSCRRIYLKSGLRSGSSCQQSRRQSRRKSFSSRSSNRGRKRVGPAEILTRDKISEGEGKMRSLAKESLASVLWTVIKEALNFKSTQMILAYFWVHYSLNLGAWNWSVMPSWPGLSESNELL